MSDDLTQRADAIVIGAGVIGSSVAFELARSGRQVVVVDKGPGPGAGSTSASAAIIRYSYSTRDPILTAWEAAQLWFDWERHLGVRDPDGMVEFVPTGNLVFRTTGFDLEGIRTLWDEFGIPYEDLDGPALSARFPWLDVGSYYPPKRVDDPAFADDADGQLSGLYNPNSGFIDDPTLASRNLAYAARQHGAEFRFRTRVVEIDRDDQAVRGVTLDSGEQIEAPVVVNVGGPHASIINRLAGVVDDMRIAHRALRAEVFVAPAPPGGSLEDGAPLVADLDVGQYFRPQKGGMLLIGGTEPACDEMHWVDDPDTNSEIPTVEGWETSMMRLAGEFPSSVCPHNRPVSLRCTTPATTGYRSTTARACTASSWRAAPAATSSRMPRWPGSTCGRSSMPRSTATTTTPIRSSFGAPTPTR